MIKRIATAVVLIPIVLLLVLKAPLNVLSIVAAAVALLAIAEFLKLVTHYTVEPMTLSTYIFVVLFFLFVTFASSGRTPLVETTAMLYGIVVAAALASFLFMTEAMRRTNLKTAYPAAAASTFAFGYIAIPMALLIALRRQPAGAIWTIFTLLAVWSGDIFAYFVGKAIGRHHMSSEISPKKTWEGAIASIVASIIIGTLWIHSAPGISSSLLRIGLIDRRDAGDRLPRTAVAKQLDQPLALGFHVVLLGDNFPRVVDQPLVRRIAPLFDEFLSAGRQIDGKQSGGRPIA